MKTTTPEIAVAPMMDWTDRHCRYFLRLIAPHVRLYTEMVTTGALLYGDRARHLDYDASEHPLALQLGGSDADELTRCAVLGQEWGYDEINLNCGCPSDRVQKGRFGACLMKEPDTVASAVHAMRTAVDIPVTVKCRIGVDEHDSEEFLLSFVDRLVDKGCTKIIIHARKAWLSGLSPKENREVPPLLYERVHAVKARYPQLRVVLNGGITTVAQTAEAIEKLDGVMIGREAYHNPWFLREIHNWGRNLFVASPVKMLRQDVALAMIDYAARMARDHGTPVKSITRHILGLYHNQPGGKRWRRALSTLPYEPGADHRVIAKALEVILETKTEGEELAA
ncbi:MAG: tRNA dihydrouridine(20/20a) synthase DusA [Alphaproteobacteria bacterium]|nr:tRNA dihydrouridine(20/20a) synthase DusA [Alphaproteobacteria bacterium]